MQESTHTSIMSRKKQNLKVNQHANFTTVHIQQMSHAMQHITIAIIFPLNLQTIITAQMPSTGGEAGRETGSLMD